MQKILLVTLLFTSSVLFSQSKMNFDLAKKIKEQASSSQLTDVFVKGNPEIVKQITLSTGGKFKYYSGDISVISIPLDKIRLFAINKSIQRIEAHTPHTKPLNDTMVIQTNVTQVHNGDAPLPQAYDGTGVVVGIIDTGIDFTHPDFQDSLGKSRIKYLWDQAKPISSNTPQPYNYGQQWTNVQIDSGMASSHNDLTYSGHGTHVAGIAVGNGLAINKFKGVAPNADIVFVAVDFNSSSSTLITDAVNYVFAKAQALGEPCAINISLGDAYGSHDGQDLQAQLINNMMNQQGGRAIVAAAGNSGNTPYHLGYTVTSDTNFTLFKYSSGGVYIPMYADTNDLKNVQFSIGADKMTPAHSFRGRINFSSITSHLGVLKEDTLFVNNKRIGRIQSFGDLNGGTYSMEFYILPDSTSYDWRLITTGTGKFDCWTNDVYNGILPSATTMNDSIYYKAPDVNQTIASSFQCLDNVIAVGNYTNRKTYIDYNGNVFVNTATNPGERHITSSIGPTRDGRIKPDITAPGDNTLAAVVLSLVPGIVANYPDALAQGGKHVRDGGTSHSSPCVAGVAALYLQKNPNATAADVKNAIIGCPKIDNFTGTSLPDNYWGYGKVNAFGALTGCVVIGINENSIKPAFSVYPNPSTTGTTLNINLTNIDLKNKNVIKIYNTLGEEVKSMVVTGNILKLSTELKPGIYLCNLQVNSRIISSEKLVIVK